MRLNQKQLFVLICLGLALVTLGVYWPITHNGFVNYDDDTYVVENPHVNSGLTATNIVWAFKSGEASNWHPLTWISHMADCEMFGLNPGGHHLINLLFHIANTLLLFVWLKDLTGAFWRSAFVAALFAWHPLHVESVAWASERKDVLSTLFWMLALLAWSRYAKGKFLSGYFLALFFFACGLMSKPMVVTLPFVLLLLDFWPLKRFAHFDLRTAGKLVLEKVPFFILSAAGSVVTFLVQKHGNAIWKPAWNTQIENIVLAYVRYISNLFWPTDLVVIYPFHRHLPAWPAIGAAFLLLLWTILFLWRAGKSPYLLIGWLWFLGTLVPAIGVVQVGSAALADRYTYIPGIGFFILVAWGADEFLERWPRWKRFLPIAAGVALIGLIGATSIQINYWHDSVKLFYHAVERTKDNYIATDALGKSFEVVGDFDRALVCFSNSVAIESRFPPSQFDYAVCLYTLQRTNEALEHFRSVEKLQQHDAEAEYALGIYLARHGVVQEGERLLRKAIADKPDYSEAENDLGILLSNQKRFAEALPHYAIAAKLLPGNTNVQFNYGLSLLDNQQPAAAEKQFRIGLKLEPNTTRVHYRLAQALDEQNKYAEAAEEYRVALKFTPDFTDAENALNKILLAHPELTNSAALDTAK